MHKTTSMLVGLSVVLTACDRIEGSTSPKSANVARQAKSDPRTSSIKLAALTAVVAQMKPHRPFTLVSSLDPKDRMLVGFATQIEREFLARLGNPKHYVSPKDVIIPKVGQVDIYTSRSGDRLEVYMIELIEDTSPTTVKVSWTKYRGPLDACGGYVLLVFENGNWTAKDVKKAWVS